MKGEFGAIRGIFFIFYFLFKLFQFSAGLVTGGILLYKARLPREIGRITLECIGRHSSICASSSGLRLNVNLPS